jgi:hypothetical protein
MPKYLSGKITVVTWEVEAESKEAAEKMIEEKERAFERVDHEGIKKTAYKLGWFEFDMPNPTPARNLVLQSFLQLISRIPGMPEVDIAESRIILPFDGDGNQPAPR